MITLARGTGGFSLVLAAGQTRQTRQDESPKAAALRQRRLWRGKLEY